MNDCLVKSLKSSCNNPDLKYFDSIPLYVKSEGTCTFFNVGETPLTLVHPNGNKETVSGNIASKFVADGEEHMYYLIGGLYDQNIVLPYCKNAKTNPENDLVYIKAEDLQGALARNIGYGGATPVTGNISDIFKFSEPNLNSTFFSFLQSTFPLSGTQNDVEMLLSKIPNVTTVYWGGTAWPFDFDAMANATNGKVNNLFGSGYKGEILNLVRKARTQGRETGDITIAYFNLNNTATIDGNAVTHGTIYGFITWTANTVSIYNGPSSSIEDATLVQTVNK